MSGKERPPVVAVASGKGGTGKTTVATNLARTAAAAGLEVSLLDTDVEEPNCGLFLSPVITRREEVTVEVPAVHESACTGCGACAEICEFSAIAMAGAVPMVFPELCHACGGCRLVCPVEAIIPRPRPVGVVEAGYVPGPRDAGRRGDAGSPDAGPADADPRDEGPRDTTPMLHFAAGTLNVGESMSSPVIKAVRSEAGGAAERLTLIDAPPGTSCPVVEALSDVDYVVLVAEPTPFGLNDLELAVEMVRALGLPAGVVINRSDVGDDGVASFCRREGIEVLLEIPEDRRVAEAYSRGLLATDAVPELREGYRALLQAVSERSAPKGAV